MEEKFAMRRHQNQLKGVPPSQSTGCGIVKTTFSKEMPVETFTLKLRVFKSVLRTITRHQNGHGFVPACWSLFSQWSLHAYFLSKYFCNTLYGTLTVCFTASGKFQSQPPNDLGWNICEPNHVGINVTMSKLSCDSTPIAIPIHLGLAIGTWSLASRHLWYTMR